MKTLLLYVFPIFIDTSGSKGEPNPDALLNFTSLVCSAVLLSILFIVIGGIHNKIKGYKFFEQDESLIQWIGIIILILFASVFFLVFSTFAIKSWLI